MTDPFHTHIQSALANPNLQIALDANAEKRISARQVAFASLPEELPVMRRRAHTVRADVIANLDHYLEQFINRAQMNGVIVHRVVDATEANRVVLDITQCQSNRTIAKSKSMVSEEIALNPALEAAGYQVVETDLGEYIVQLRGEHPAHIITPAVHLRRSEVGQTFHDKLGIPLTDDIPTLTAVARRVLRQVFLDAGIGISGVNFGVAETGTYCLVTNEGNGRMVTTIPPVHIALMGMERLVPTLDDLALMLYLLPRSATGQKLSVYTSLIHSPRRVGELDGAQERHLIILDNGRTAMRNSPLAEALYCIRCGSCLNACPVFREIGGHAYVSKQGIGSPYPGPIGSVVSAGLFSQQEFGQLARASSLCGACMEACPVEINLPKLLLRVRAGGLNLTPQRANLNIPKPVSLGLRLFTWFAENGWRFTIAQKAAGIGSRLISPFSTWLRLPAFTGWGFSKDMPRPVVDRFRDRWRKSSRSNKLGHEIRIFENTIHSDPLRSFEKIPEGDRPLNSTHATLINSDNRPALITQFAEELTALGGKFYACTEADLGQHIQDLLSESGIHEIHAWDRAFFPPGLLEILVEGGIDIHHTPSPTLKAGLTGCLAGIAETGTLVLPGGPGHPLTASLLPEIHIAVLRSGDILATLPQVFKLGEVREAASISLITGPSRTADIEMTLTIGVHGPREVYVFCLV